LVASVVDMTLWPVVTCFDGDDSNFAPTSCGHRPPLKEYRELGAEDPKLDDRWAVR